MVENNKNGDNNSELVKEKNKPKDGLTHSAVGLFLIRPTHLL